MDVDASLRSLAVSDAVCDELDVRDVYVRERAFLWRSLQRLGIRSHDLEDVMQEVLLVVHRRADSYEPRRSHIRTWLFGICMRVVRGYQRRARSRVRALDEPAVDPVHNLTPETELHRRRLQQKLQSILDELSVEKRAAFVLFELARS